MTGLSEACRQETLAELEQRIDSTFDNEHAPSNIELQKFFAQFGGVAHHAETLEAQDGETQEAPILDEVREDAPPPEGSIWLGVCSAMARRMGWPVWSTRTPFVLIGLAVPLGLSFYLLCYGWIYLKAPAGALPPIRKATFAKRFAGTAAVLVLLGMGSELFLRLAYLLFIHYTDHTEILLGKWGWFDTHGTSIFIALTALLTPMAMLSELPMRNAWDETFKHLVKAILAVYAVLLSMGIASSLAGLIFQFVQSLTRNDLAL